MKFESRLLISQLCAAGATGLLSSLLIAGCASGERAGRFWNKGDIASSDAYAASELARDEAFAANAKPAIPATGAKVAPAGGTQDSKGHVAMSDTADTPPPPLVSDGSPSISDLASPSANGAPRSPNAAPTSGAAASSTGTGAAAAEAAAGSVQVAGAAAGGRIIAPYVQKRPPSGVVDNNNHDSEIVKPKQVFAKQLDPFAETEATLYATPASTRPTPAQPSAVVSAVPNERAPIASPSASVAPVAMNAAPAPRSSVNSPSVSPVPADPTPVDPTPANSSPVDPNRVDPNSAATQAGRVAMSNSDGSGQATGVTATPTPPATSSSVASAPPTRSASDAFDPSLPAPTPIAARAANAKQAAPLMPTRPHAGIRLGDEDLDAEPQDSSRSEVQPLFAPVSTQAAAEAPATVAAEARPSVAAEASSSVAAVTPYEAELHHETSTRPCVVPPAPPAPHPAGATSPSQPVQDSWESRKSSLPAAEPVHAAVAPPIRVTAAPSGSVEPTQPTAPTTNSSPKVSPSAVAPSVSPVSRETVWAEPAAPERHDAAIPASAAPASDVSTATKPQSRESRALASRSAVAAGSEPAAPLVVVPTRAAHKSASVEHQSNVTAPAPVEAVVRHTGSDPMVRDSASIHGRYTGDDSAAAPLNAAGGSLQPAAAPVVPAKRVLPSAKKLTRKSDTASQSKSTSFWDDALMSPAGKHTVSTADFSVAAPPMPADADDAQPAGAQSAASSGKTASGPKPAKTRAGLLVGMMIGLAVSAVLWRRWRQSGEAATN